MNNNKLIFLKLGGSLITDKSHPLTPHLEIIQRISVEIAQIRKNNPHLKLVLGHGSGSFGHSVANLHQTQKGVQGKASWQGFAEVWAAARDLNQIIIQHLTARGLPVIAFPPSAGIIAENHTVRSWDIAPLKAALSHNLIPVVQGDVIFDKTIGGTIFSTENIFQFLAEILHPRRILLAGLDPGVYRQPSQSHEIIDSISTENIEHILPALSGAGSPDVTGGMASKVRSMFELVQSNPSLEVLIFSGMQPGNIEKAIRGENLGTLITK